MARPQKTGLDYFPLDVDIDQDDKVAIIEAQHGIVGFGIVVKLLMKIYDTGYFYEWTEREQILFSNRVNVNINGVSDSKKYTKEKKRNTVVLNANKNSVNVDINDSAKICENGHRYFVDYCPDCEEWELSDEF